MAMNCMSDESGWIDISVPIATGMPVWPGDPKVVIERLQDGKGADGATLSRIRTGLHAGTHVDAPLHFLPGAEGIDLMPVAAMLGPARVIALEVQECIEATDLRAAQISAGERILLKTRNSRLWRDAEFHRDFVHLSSEAADYLARSGVRTVGIDYLSVSGYGKDAAAVHRRLLGAGAWIIEGLDLSAAPPGDYFLYCLPLKIAGAEAAPARAFLRRLPVSEEAG